MSQMCPVHHVPSKLLPAGTSKKTGKPYNAFWVCTVQDCRAKQTDLEVGDMTTNGEVLPPGASPAMTVKPYVSQVPAAEARVEKEETADMWKKKGEQMNRSNLAGSVLQGKELDWDMLEQLEAWVITGERPTKQSSELEDIAASVPF